MSEHEHHSSSRPSQEGHKLEVINERINRVHHQPDPFKLKDLAAPVLIAAVIILIGWLLLKFFFLPRLFGG